MKKITLLSLLCLLPLAMFAQDRPDLVGVIEESGSRPPRIAVPDVKGLVGTDNQTAFNTTLWNDLEASGRLEMISKSFYPRTAPTRPEDVRFGESGMPSDPGDRGLFAQGWMLPPVQSRYLVFGSLETINERLVLNGFLYDVTQESPAGAYVFGKRYYGTMDVAGSQQIAHDFSRDILQNLGLGIGLAGSRIYFVSDITGESEIWSMDYDGENKKQLTNYKNLCTTPAVSPDGARLAFTTFVEGTPQIFMHSLETGRRLNFFNQTASLNTTPAFSPDGKKLLYASSITGRSQIYEADLDGRNLRRISYSRSIDVDPAVNPQTAALIAFVSGRSGTPQVYLMDSDGANVRRLSLGGGDAAQPSWDPQGENIAFAWTRGFEPGNYNIFVINVATEELTQLTYGAGRNEHPTWSPSGTHLVFTSDRAGGTQIWTMRADGTQLRKLTTRGRNRQPIWAAR